VPQATKDCLHGDPERNHDNRALVNTRNRKQRRKSGPEIARGHAEGQNALLPLSQSEAEPVRGSGRHCEKHNPGPDRITPDRTGETFCRKRSRRAPA
jgi:hypothetical protein